MLWFKAIFGLMARFSLFEIQKLNFSDVTLCCSSWVVFFFFFIDIQDIKPLETFLKKIRNKGVLGPGQPEPGQDWAKVGP